MTQTTQKKQLAFGKIPSYRKYELFMERYRSAAEDFINPFVSKFSSSGPAKLLDIGSGDGYLKFFCEQQNIEFHGIELHPRRIKVCQELGYDIKSFNIEKERFPYQDNQYDVIVASHVLEHLYHPEITLKEMYRTLKPGGIIIIGVPMHVSWIAKIMLLKEKLFPAAEFDHHQFYSMKSLKEFLKEYKVIDIRGFRLISSRKRFNWEDNYKFYQFNTWWGKRFPAFSPEVNVVIQK